MNKKEKALELFMSGCSCAQAVAGAFATEMGMTEEKAKSVSACFGAGVCSTRQLCGALSGGLMVLGGAEGWHDVRDKALAYQEGKKLLDDFTVRFGTTVCFDLLTKAKAVFGESPMARDEAYYKARPCAVFVAFVSEWLEGYLAEDRL